jgi:amidohydrolase
LLSSGTGLLCDLGVVPGGPVIALRADIDALGMDDLKEVGHRSTVPGVAHGCGHDLHTSVVLGAGLALAGRLGTEGALPFRDGVGIRLVFEPAEESVPGGAVTVIEDGGLDGVAAIFGFHADPKIDVGCVGIRTGPLTSAADVVEITLSGPGGHTARPQLTVDLVAVAGRIAHELPSLVHARSKGMDGGIDVVFGALQAGHAPNVIPTRAVLRGSVRTADRALWAEAESFVRSALQDLVGPSGAEVVCAYHRGVPPVVNSPDESALVASAARSVLGGDAVLEPPRSNGGDSFAWYQERVPGCYARLGVHDPTAGGDRLDLHSGRFDVDDRALAVGIRVMLRSVELLSTRLDR